LCIVRPRKSLYLGQDCQAEHRPQPPRHLAHERMLAHRSTVRHGQGKTVFQANGKQVWGYHGPSGAGYLNTFVDVPPMKSRLLSWLAAQQELSGWLYWYSNWGSFHSPSAADATTGLILPVGPVNPNTWRFLYNPRTNGRKNEDGNLLYAGETGPLSSQRLELLRMGFEDRALLGLLTTTERSVLATRLVCSALNFTFDHPLLEQSRRDAARAVGARQCKNDDRTSSEGAGPPAG
jgi:hypothetical protein